MASSQVVEIQEPVEKSKNQVQGLERQQKKWGLIFLSPWIIGFTIFTAMPIIISLYWTFTDFSLGTGEPPQWIGLANWQRLFTRYTAFAFGNVTLRIDCSTDCGATTTCYGGTFECLVSVGQIDMAYLFLYALYGACGIRYFRLAGFPQWSNGLA